MPKSKANADETVAPKQGIDMNAEEVLVPDNVGVIKYGSEVIKIKPMSLRTALKIGKFITSNFGRAFNSESFQKAKQDVNITTFELWTGLANDFLSVLDDEEIISLLCDLTEKDNEFIKKNFSLLGLTRVLKAVYFTEDFEEIFLEVRSMMEKAQERSQKTQ